MQAAGTGHVKRINRDVHDLFHHDFNNTAASLRAEEMASHMGQHPGQSHVSSEMCGHDRVFYSIKLTVCPHEGPYKGGHFIFSLNIPESYPFSGVEVWVATSTRPIWHPNIDLVTGRVMLPLEWSPVLTLTSLALAIQMMLLEPSAESPLNLEACSYYTRSTSQFTEQVQRTLKGCNMGGVHFLPMHLVLCKCCTRQQHLLEGYNQEGYFVRRLNNSMEENVSHLSDEFDMILDTGAVGAEKSLSQSRKRRVSAIQEGAMNSAYDTSKGGTRQIGVHVESRVGGKRRFGPRAEANDGANGGEGLSEISPIKRSRTAI